MPTADARDFMEYITAIADVHAVRMSPLLVGHHGAISLLAYSEGSISIHKPETYPSEDDDDDDSDRLLNLLMMGNAINYAATLESFSNSLLSRATPHPSQNQASEHAVGDSRRVHVQNRTEETRSAITTFKSMGLDALKPEAVKAANRALAAKAEEKGEIHKRNPDPSGSTLMVPLLEERLKHMALIDTAMKSYAPDMIDSLVEVMKKKNATKRAKEEMFSNLDKELNKRPNKRQRIAATTGGKNYILVTACMGGQITIGKLLKGKGHEPYLHAELDHRGEEYHKEDDSFTELKNKLRRHEFGRLQAANIRIYEQWKDVKTFVPESEKMRELLGLG